MKALSCDGRREGEKLSLFKPVVLCALIDSSNTAITQLRAPLIDEVCAEVQVGPQRVFPWKNDDPHCPCIEIGQPIGQDTQ